MSRQARGLVRLGMLGGLQWLLSTGVIALFAITFLAQAFQIPSESMENTLLIGDYVLVDKVDFAHGGIWGHILPYQPIRCGDIIVFRYPVDPEQHFVKRVVGVPGDRVRLVDKHVLVNGRPIDESHAIFTSHSYDVFRDNFPRMDYLSPSVELRWWMKMPSVVKNGELVVPPGEYFVMGDNRDDSSDSRYWGFVPRENIIGRPLLIYWSVRSASPRSISSTATDGTLSRFAYVLLHVQEEMRWNRIFHQVQ
ncbi:MAG TPA: signal peptidase I [Terriglobales bacterium]|jgi:signal peptidase I|nr:signal peptidase I [Terriglobales bacterium]